MAESILLIGAGGHARACIDVIEQEARYKVMGLIGLESEVGGEVLGYPILGSDGDLSKFLKKCFLVLIGVGQIKTPKVRIRLFEQLQHDRCIMPTIVSPYAYVSPHAKLGVGTIVMHGAIINAGVVVGRNCIVNSHALLEHDVCVGDHCHISTSSAINSGVTIGQGTFVGSGSLIRQSLIIGENCLIGMGQVVLTNCMDGSQLPMRKDML